MVGFFFSKHSWAFSALSVFIASAALAQPAPEPSPAPDASTPVDDQATVSEAAPAPDEAQSEANEGSEDDVVSPEVTGDSAEPPPSPPQGDAPPVPAGVSQEQASTDAGAVKNDAAAPSPALLNPSGPDATQNAAPAGAPASRESRQMSDDKDAQPSPVPGGGQTRIEGEQPSGDQVSLPETQPQGWFQSFLGAGVHPKFTVGVAGGYALRMHEDDRTHGGGLTGFVDVPLAYGFGAQFLGYGQGWIPSEKAPDPLGLVGAAGSLIYAFDDADAVAWVGVGPTAAVGLVADNGALEFKPHAGALLSFGVRFPLGESTRAEVAVRAPIYVWDPEGGLNVNLPIGTSQVSAPSQGLFPTQVLMTAGLNFEPFGFMDALNDHGDITRALLPEWLLFGAQKNVASRDSGPADKDTAPTEKNESDATPSQSDDTN